MSRTIVKLRYNWVWKVILELRLFDVWLSICILFERLIFIKIKKITLFILNLFIDYLSVLDVINISNILRITD